MATFSKIIPLEQQCFITLKPHDKKPVQNDWPNNGQTFDAAHVPGHNVGILLGKASGFLDVDLDCKEAVALAAAILPKPNAIFGRGAPDSLHYLYRGNSFGPRRAFTSTNPNKAMLVELRGDGSQTMVPPSIHPNGEELTLIETNQEQNDISYEELLKHVSLLAAASELMQHWVKGQRHTLALGFSGLCLKQGVDANLVMKIIQWICRATGDPEVDDRFNAIRTSVNQPAQKNAGFTKLKEALGETVAKSISERVCLYTGKQSSAEIVPHMQSFNDIIELGQFVDRANVTEAKMGQAFSQWLSGKALYVIETKRWMIWNGRYWEVDLCNKMHNLAFDYVQVVKSTLNEQNSIHGARDLSSFESLNRLQNIITFASSRLSVSSSKFDVDPMVLATATDWVNLETGVAHPPDANILVSKATEVSYFKNAECPTFLTFVDDIFEGNMELIRFVQNAIGYSLTGSTREQCLFIMIGDGANGKSTFINVINKLLGTYGTTAAAQTLIANGGNSIGDDLVDLVGARLISVSETEEGQSLAEAKIKQMTGGDTLKGRPLYGNYVEFTIQGKLWLATNSLPQINNSDHGIWRRITAIPFNRTFSASEQDKGLTGKLLAELPGILNWAIAGCLDWQENGLQAPTIVQDQVAEYRSSMDSISEFLQEECAISSEHSCTATQLYAAYRTWCVSIGKRAKTKTAFKRAIGGIQDVYQKRLSSGLYWMGIQPFFVG